MNKEIEKMSDELLFTEYTNNLVDLVSNGSLDNGERRKEISDYIDILRFELLKRLSSKSVEEYKKKLVDEIEIYIEAEQRDHFYWKEILEFINNLK